MKTNTLLLLLVLLLLVLASCQFLPQQGVKMPTYVATGTEALTMQFETASRSNIFMCQSSEIITTIKNTGNYDITDGKYSFIFEGQMLEAATSSKPATGEFSVTGKSRDNPYGEMSQFIFQLKNKGLPQQLETYATPVIFQTCYNYKTRAAIQVCIDPDIMNSNPTKACKAQPIMLTGGQGAPVAITRIESIMMPEGDEVRPLFIIYVQNLGSGKIIGNEAVDAKCKAPENADEEEKIVSMMPYITVTEVKLGEKLTCNPQVDNAPPKIKIDPDSEARFTCESTRKYGKGAGTFSSILEITLDYGYLNTAIFPITITRLPGQAGCSS